RMTYGAALYASLTWAEAATGAPAWGYFGLLWVLPLFTTFPVFMIFREWCQHGNADRGRMTNTRVFFVDPFSRYAVFPLGMEYHLPHHLFASVPHYKLKALHELMGQNPEYAAKGRIVENWAGHAPSGNPTIIDILGPKYTPTGERAYVDETVTEDAEIRDRDAIDKHSEQSARS
ncbi:MAG: fatty acid desaturase, partial [Pseudomonadota bacterium]